MQAGAEDGQAVLAAQRLSLAARIAALAAHSMNNVLLGAAGNLELMVARAKLEGSAEELARDSLASLALGDALAGSLGTIARLDDYTSAEVDPLALLHDWAEEGRAGPHAGLQLELDLPAIAPRLRVDAGYLICALNALLENAAEAQRGKGSVLLSCARSPHPTGMLRISMADTGPGFTANSAKRAFELGYTTKQSSRAIGIGLWYVRELAHACSGEARIEPVQTGATVSLYLAALP